MGIDIHGLNFLRYASGKKGLGRVATIGRQTLLLTPGQIAAMIDVSAPESFGLPCDGLLSRHFGATVVDSYDYSDYEGATFTVDMNKPFAPTRQYDTVMEFGCVEHIYNAPQALANISLLCAEGGQIVHVSPGNNFCGHGFWQLSPELFFSLYSEANGYRETEIFFADVTEPRYWFEVQRPRNGTRAEVTTRTPVYVMCRTRRVTDFHHDSVQQSDYVHIWKQAEVPRKARFKNEILVKLERQIRSRPRLFHAIWSARQSVRAVMNPTDLSRRNPHLRKHKVVELLPDVSSALQRGEVV